MAEKFWGRALEYGVAFTVVPQLWPVVLGNGARKALTGQGTFQEGVNEIADGFIEPALEKIGRFGDEYGEEITKAAIWAAMTALFRVIPGGAQKA